MIEELKNDDIIEKAGGRFKLAALMQRRWLELMQGSRPMVEIDGSTELDIIAKEIMTDKIAARDLTASSSSEESSSDDDSE